MSSGINLKLKERVTETTQLREIAFADISVMAILSRFGISPGFGKKRVGEICKEKGIDESLFLTVINEYLGKDPGEKRQEPARGSVVKFLKDADKFYEEIQVPNIMRHMRPLTSEPGELGRYLAQLALKFKERSEYDSVSLFPMLLEREEENWENEIIEKALKFDKNLENELEDLLEFFIVHLQSNFNPNMLLGVITAVDTLKRDVNGSNRIRRKLLIKQEDREDLLSGVADIEKKDTMIIPDNKYGSENELEKYPEDNILTQREKEVLALLACGKSNKEVADELCISVNTSITHRRNIISKLGIRSLAGLSLYAYTRGLMKKQ